MPRDPARDLAGARIAVIAHLYYPDLWPEILAALRRIPIAFDLFVTLPAGNVRALSKRVRGAFPEARLLVTANRGRDLGPFFEAVLRAEAVAPYTAICKIHTKKGITEPATWRSLLLDSVLGSPDLVAEVVRAFLDEPELDLVGSRDLYFSGPKFVEVNKAGVERLARALHPAAPMPRRWGFVAGTMFWFRPSLVAPLARLVADRVAFDDDIRANDGQVAHALERVLGLLPTLQGRKIGLVAPAGGEGPRLTVCRAPGEPSTEPPSRFLKRQAAALGPPERP